jgi:hypothetical protein
MASISDVLPFLNDSHKFVLITGAGLSAEAGLPLWEQLRDAVLQNIFPYENDCAHRTALFLRVFNADIEQASRIMGILPPQYIPPEAILLALREVSSPRERLSLLNKHLIAFPSRAFFWISELIATKHIRHYVTLNIDELLETVLHTFEWKSGLSWVSLVSEKDFESWSINASFPLVKIHGTLSCPQSLCIEPDRLIRLAEAKRRFLAELLIGKEYLVFFGYRGQDPDLCVFFDNELGATIKSSRIKRAFFMNQDDWSVSLPPLVPILQRHGVVVTHISIDQPQYEFFRTWAEYCASDISLSRFELPKSPGKLTVAQPITDVEALQSEWSPSTEAEVVAREFTGYDVVVSAPSSFTVAGDYGVFISGKEAFLRLPLRTFVGIKHATDLRCEATFDEEMQSCFGPRYLQSRQESFKLRLDVCLRQLCNDITRYVPQWTSPFCAHVKVFSEIPLGVGLEDNVPLLLLAGLNGLIRRTSHQNFWDWQERKCLYEIISRAMEIDYFAVRRSTGYLHAMPAACLQADKMNSPLLGFDRGRWMPDLDSLLSLERTNVPSSVNFGQIIEQALSSELEPISFDIQVVLVITSRHSLSVASEVGTVESVNALLQEEVGRGCGRLHALSAITEEFFRQAFRSTTIDVATLHSLSKLMTAYHYGINMLGRAGTRTNSLIGTLLSENGFLGGKMAGAGPGGAVLLLVERNKESLMAVSRMAKLSGANIYDSDVLAPCHTERRKGMKFHRI